MFNIAGILKGLSLPEQINAALRGLLGASDQRQAFVALMLATATNVQNKPNFNLELEINDLWTRLGALRNGSAGGMAGAMGQASQLMNAMSHQQKALNDAMMQVIRNIR